MSSGVDENTSEAIHVAEGLEAGVGVGRNGDAPRSNAQEQFHEEKARISFANVSCSSSSSMGSNNPSPQRHVPARVLALAARLDASRLASLAGKRSPSKARRGMGPSFGDLLAAKMSLSSSSAFFDGASRGNTEDDPSPSPSDCQAMTTPTNKNNDNRNDSSNSISTNSSNDNNDPRAISHLDDGSNPISIAEIPGGVETKAGSGSGSIFPQPSASDVREPSLFIPFLLSSMTLDDVTKVTTGFRRVEFYPGVYFYFIFPFMLFNVI